MSTSKVEEIPVEPAPAPPYAEKSAGLWQAFKSVFIWYPSTMSPAEKKLVLKLDISILTFCCFNCRSRFSYVPKLTFFFSALVFLKYLDQSNVNSAYVSGMKEELSLNGNQLAWFGFFYYFGYMFFQLPFLLLLSRPKIARYLFPTVEIGWAVLTFSQSRVQSAKHLYAIRFLLGALEAPSFSGANFIIGSWFHGEEIFRRAGVFMISNQLGQMFSGYLQSAAYTNLNGVHGMSGWRWLFIVDGVITLPIALFGFVMFPGLPQSGKPWFLTKEEHQMALERQAAAGAAPPKSIGMASIKRILSRWHIWMAVAIYVFHLNATYPVGFMSLWLKSIKNGDGTPHYSVVKINNYPTIVNAFSIITTWLAGSLARNVNIWVLWCIIDTIVLFGFLVLLVWNVPTGLKFVAYVCCGASNAPNPLLFSWINVVTRRDSEERAATLATAMTVAWAFFAFLPLVLYPTPEAPRWLKGYSWSVTMVIISTALFLVGGYLTRREERQIARDEATRGQLDAVSGTGVDLDDLKEGEERREDIKSAA